MSICTFSSVNAANLFIDLATFSEQEGFLYGGPDAVTLFVAAVQKANWFSYVPISLRHVGTIDFGQRNVSACVNRSGDYVLHIWFRAQIPKIDLRDPGVDGTLGSPAGQGTLAADASIRWTRNLMHNLFEKVLITFNELCVHEFDSYWLDFNFQYRKAGAKRVGYRNMIGDIGAMTNSVPSNTPLGTGGYFSVPFPLFFTEDSGIALPVAALPFNDIKVNYCLRKWDDLVVVNPGGCQPVFDDVAVPVAARTLTSVAGLQAKCSDVYQVGTQAKPQLLNAETYAHYVVVHNDERVMMGDAPRDMLIHQVQATQVAPFKDISSSSSFDIRLSHSIVLFCFAAQNTSLLDLNSCTGEWSNYTTEPEYQGLDPIAFTTLVYENTVRVAQGSDYYSLIQPDLIHPAIPDETGYHIWSYSLLPWDPLKPAGSTNYSKLANVSITHEMSPAAQAAAGLNAGGVPVDQLGRSLLWPPCEDPEPPAVVKSFPQRFRHVFQARNWNIARVANGSLGFPTL